MRKASRRANKGQAVLEMLVGSMVFIPITLFMLDMCFALFCTQIVDHLAKNAARLASHQVKHELAEKVARTHLSTFKTSALIPAVQLGEVNYVDDDHVIVKVKLQAKLPVEFAMINNNPVFQAQAVEAIVVKSKKS